MHGAIAERETKPAISIRLSLHHKSTTTKNNDNRQELMGFGSLRPSYDDMLRAIKKFQKTKASLCSAR
jgi:hypothetical protein